MARSAHSRNTRPFTPHAPIHATRAAGTHRRALPAAISKSGWNLKSASTTPMSSGDGGGGSTVDATAEPALAVGVEVAAAVARGGRAGFARGGGRRGAAVAAACCCCI